MTATTKLRIATFLRGLADRLNPPAQTITVSYQRQMNSPIDGNTTGWTGGWTVS